MHKKDIKNHILKELEKVMVAMGEPAYRAKQIFFWLYKRGAHDFDTMKNLSKTLKTKLNKDYCVGNIEPSEHFTSVDGTEKALLKLKDGNFIEAVLISAGHRKTLCLSTQVGCKFSCPFCASGRIGFVRDLTASEIIDQILYFRHTRKHAITNYVFMGMGEPLDNYENVKKAVMIMNNPQGMGVGSRRITVSTCGIVPGIEKLKNLGFQVNLSVSIHAANNTLRNKLVPINKIYSLEELVKSCKNFVDTTGRMITLEYVLIKDVNDSLKNAEELAQLAGNLKAKINLIPYSEVPGLRYRVPLEDDTALFIKRIKEKRISVTLRESKGNDIQAACGQLAGKRA